MSNIICDNCGFDENPLGATYCDACGCELTDNVSSSPTSTSNNYNPSPDATVMPETDSVIPSPPETVMPEMDSMTSSPPETVVSPSNTPPMSTPEVKVAPPPDSFYTPSVMGSAKLVAKSPDYPQSEFELSSSEHSIVGRFDDTTGPVDIDLGSFPHGDTISRNQAEIYFDGNQWKIKPISTTNGTFIKKAGETRFGSALNAPEVLNSGDEIAFAKVRFIFQTY